MLKSDTLDFFKDKKLRIYYDIWNHMIIYGAKEIREKFNKNKIIQIDNFIREKKLKHLSSNFFVSEKEEDVIFYLNLNNDEIKLEKIFKINKSFTYFINKEKEKEIFEFGRNKYNENIYNIKFIKLNRRMEFELNIDNLIIGNLPLLFKNYNKVKKGFNLFFSNVLENKFYKGKKINIFNNYLLLESDIDFYLYKSNIKRVFELEEDKYFLISLKKEEDNFLGFFYKNKIYIIKKESSKFGLKIMSELKKEEIEEYIEKNFTEFEKEHNKNILLLEL